MAAIYLRYSDGQMTQRTEDEVRNLWTSGLIPRKAIYWKEGMVNWEPVVAWLGERESSVSEPETVEHQEYSFRVDPTRLTKVLQTLLWTNALVGVLAVVLDFWTVAQLQLGRTTLDQIGNDPIQRNLEAIQLLVGLFVLVAFLKWKFRAYKNIEGFGAENLRYSPIWAVVYYFIPFISLIRPVQIMSEIWRASENPRDWSQRKGSSLIIAWWTLFLASGFAFELSQFPAILDPTESTQWPWEAVFATTSDFLSIPFSIVLYRLVTSIYLSQKKLVERG
jgi:uncharacterized protein DUF4328